MRQKLSCDNCRFFQRRSEKDWEEGECRRWAPDRIRADALTPREKQMDSGDDWSYRDTARALFPLVTIYDWCGEHVTDPDPDPPPGTASA